MFRFNIFSAALHLELRRQQRMQQPLQAPSPSMLILQQLQQHQQQFCTQDLSLYQPNPRGSSILSIQEPVGTG